MCGVPHHAAEGYIRRLLEMGRKIAIGDQIEDPRFAKGIVKRDITRVLTPGLAADSVESHEPAWLVALGGGPGAYGVAFLERSRGGRGVTTEGTEGTEMEGRGAEITEQILGVAIAAPRSSPCAPT